MKVELGLKLLERLGSIDRSAGAELHAHAANHLGFAQAVGRTQLVLCDSIGIEAAQQILAFKDGGRRTVPAKLGCTGQRRRAAADAGNLHVARSARGGQQFLARGLEGVHRVTLQPGNLDRRVVVAMHHACAFAEHFHRAGLRTACAKNIRIQNPQCRTAQIPGADALDKARNVDMRGAGAGAGRVKAIQATIGFNDCSLRLQRRLDVAEPLAQQKIVG